MTDEPAPNRLTALVWRAMDWRIGIVPAPVAVAIVAILAVLIGQGALPADILVAIASLSLGGFLCAEIGNRLPLLSSIGAAAIIATFLPSYLVYAHILPAPLTVSITAFTKSSNFLYLFIACVIVGSILGMDRRMLIGGFVRIFVPLAAGTVVATAAGCVTGWALGLGLQHTFYKIVIPIMAGGVGEGALPLSMGYAPFMHQAQGALFAEILPVVMFGSLTAILLAGGLNLIGKRFPKLTGNGRLQPVEAVETETRSEPPAPPSLEIVAAAAVLAVTLYLAGTVAQTLWKFPAPVAMLVAAVALKLLRVVPPGLERGADVVYRFFRTAVTYPLLFAIGVSLTPWDKLIEAFNAPTLITVVVTVTAMVATGFVAGKLVGLYPIDAAIVTACHSGQGGTGDVAILTATERMSLMPFSQIATRIGGAIMVLLAVTLLKLSS
ncbi:MAG TPA: 2-hydroxycarboxylate transporter family protein [Caulobacteraceae bacterium]|jgi:CCS family citrate carrier protein